MTCTSISASTTHAFEPAAWLSQFESVGGAFALTSRGLQLWIVPGGHSDSELSQARWMVSHLTTEQRAALKDRLGARVGESSAPPSSNSQPSSTLFTAGNAGDHQEGTDSMNMMTAIRANTALTALNQHHHAATALDTANWTSLMASYLAAKQVEDDYADQVWNPAYDREQTFVKASGRKDIAALCQEYPEEFIPLVANAEIDRLGDIRYELEKVLIATPAPNAEALRWKLDYLLRDRDGDGGVPGWSNEFIAQTVADYRRLLNAAPVAPDVIRHSDAIDRYWPAFHGHNADQLDELAYLEALEGLHDYAPASHRDFVRKFEAAFAHGGAPDDDRIEQMIGEASALLGPDSRFLPPANDKAAPAPERGTHALCDDERGLWVDLPDLRAGRTLDDALAHLSATAVLDPRSYPEEWFEEIRDVGAYASVNYPREGDRHLYVGQTCDEQMDERRRRSDALTEHMQAIEGMYDRVGDFLEDRGHVADNRPRDMRETTAAVRGFVLAGFRVFLHPDGKLGASDGMPKEWVNACAQRAREIEDAARRYERASRRFHNRPQIKRAIRMLGTVRSNGFIVLRRRGD